VDVTTSIDQARYRDRLLRHIQSIVGDWSEAEDLLQDVLLKAHRGEKGVRDQGAISTWLFRIATHVSLDRLRQQRRQPQCTDAGDQRDDPESEEGEPPILQKLLEQKEMSACVRRYVEDLSDHYRAVLLLHDLEGLAATEIASLLGLSIANVKARLRRARRSLQAALEAGCSFHRDERGVIVCEPK
jgi:RNA polymerase sigma-70 factor (ECF subfamily)